jgi:hypothetical protein
MSSINIKFPLQDDNETGFLFKTNKLSIDAIKSDLLLLMLTQKGERYYNPDYGTNLKKFIFEPNDDLTEFDIKEEIKVAKEGMIRMIFKCGRCGIRYWSRKEFKDDMCKLCYDNLLTYNNTVTKSNSDYSSEKVSYINSPVEDVISNNVMTWSVLSNQAVISDNDNDIHHSSHDMLDKCCDTTLISTNNCDYVTDSCTSSDSSCDCSCGGD